MDHFASDSTLGVQQQTVSLSQKDWICWCIPGRWGCIYSFTLLPFNGPVFGITFSNLLELAGFSTSVILAMFNAREYKKHARWMISSIFWILPPATSRLIGFIMWVLDDYNGTMWRMEAWYASLFTMVIPLSIMIYRDYRKEKIIYRAYLLPLIGAFPIILLNPIMQESQWWIKFCKTVIGQGI
ncbi:MAG: hypothetical protein OEV74_17820 [Cyclobacteriaceae bacterium]|nr:hypothetical protein [Cyclobacteriaceae bacterium]MDH5250017.1 hypothetical protein [Cyclobacteriaceae bacterium]